jgi:hypothetical protein
MARYADTLLKIDVSSGDLLWEMSGAYSDFQFPDDRPVYVALDQTYLWSHPHFSQLLGDEGIMVFDNGSNYSPAISSLAEFSWDESALTVLEDWRYPDPTGRYTESLGDARKLSNGNVLASWMTIGRLDEISPAGEVLWSVDTLGVNTRRLFFVEDLYNLRSNDEATE